MSEQEIFTMQRLKESFEKASPEYAGHHIFSCLRRGITDIEVNPAPWLLADEPVIGFGTIYNTPVSASQLTMAIGMSSHSVVQALLDKSYFKKSPPGPEVFDNLLANRVLNGMRILDLGCGVVPMADRAMRALGAEVYTVDFEPATKFKVDAEWQDSPFLQMERDHHIVADFGAPDVIEKIRAVAGDEGFDLVTNSQSIDMGWNSFGRTTPRDAMVEALLKPGGIFYNADQSTVEVKTPCSPQATNAMMPA